MQVGGYDGASRQCLSTVECYNPETNTWTMVADMNARRSGAGLLLARFFILSSFLKSKVKCWKNVARSGVGVCNGILYAVGGHDGPLVRNSVDAYNPEKNIWYPVADMACCRRNAGMHSRTLIVDIKMAEFPSPIQFWISFFFKVRTEVFREARCMRTTVLLSVGFSKPSVDLDQWFFWNDCIVV